MLAVLRRQPGNVLRAAGLRFAENSTFYIHTTFVLTYGTVMLGMARGDLLLAVIIASAIGLVTIPFYGWACDRFGRRPVVLWGSLVLLAMSWPYFWALDTRSLPLIVLATVIAVNVGNSAVYAPQPAYFSELFEPEVRYSGASIGAQGASVFAGGLAPVIATALLDATGGYDWIAIYMSAMVLITIVAAVLSPDPYRAALKKGDRCRCDRGAARRAQGGVQDQVGDDLAGGLVGRAGPLGERGQPRARGRQRLEHQVRRHRDALVAGGVDPGQELVGHRDVVLEVVARPAADRYVVVSGFGDRAQWYRNVLADPRVRVSVGRRSRAPATARVLPVGEAGAVIAGYVEQRPRAWAWFGPVVGRTLGRPVGASAPPPPMVELRLADGQRSPGAPSGG